MDKKGLVVVLTNMFQDVRRSGLFVDAFMLAPVYEGFMSNVYILAVSAPSLGQVERYDKMDLLIDTLHEHVSSDYRRMIDRVRVYNSIEDLKSHAQSGFDDSFDDVCETPLSHRMELVEV
ncbi:MAG: hypothetical protein EOO39_12410 [Cytophagaceae bacterium]|nr:MAG: hypothetical protein EOO39_12410 [Cytophagaceae bacterium]